MTVHVFQIGCRDIGRIGFEQFLDLETYFPLEVEFEGVYCKDFDAEDRAMKYAESQKKDVEFFNDIKELYSVAEDKKGSVLIYDAGPPHLHSRNIARSLEHGFHHLVEKPPSVTREEHIAERKLAANSPINYKVDFIERENPVVKKAVDIVDADDIENIEVFRESSFGVQKILQPVDFAHVKGGAVLDKMSNDIFILDLIGNKIEFEDAKIDYLMPKELGGEKILNSDGSGARKITEKTAVGKCKGVFSSGDINMELNASWLGLSDEARVWNRKISEKFAEEIVRSEHREIDGKGFQNEECRFFVIEGEKKLLCDLRSEKIYDLEKEETIEVPELPRDQLYRVLEKAVLDAAELEKYKINEDEVDDFMNCLFDVQDQCSGDVFEEVDRSTERIRSLMSSDKKISDKIEAEGVAR